MQLDAAALAMAEHQTEPHVAAHPSQAGFLAVAMSVFDDQSNGLGRSTWVSVREGGAWSHTDIPFLDGHVAPAWFQFDPQAAFTTDGRLHVIHLEKSNGVGVTDLVHAVRGLDGMWTTEAIASDLGRPQEESEWDAPGLSVDGDQLLVTLQAGAIGRQLLAYQFDGAWSELPRGVSAYWPRGVDGALVAAAKTTAAEGLWRPGGDFQPIHAATYARPSLGAPLAWTGDMLVAAYPTEHGAQWYEDVLGEGTSYGMPLDFSAQFPDGPKMTQTAAKGTHRAMLWAGTSLAGLGNYVALDGQEFKILDGPRDGCCGGADHFVGLTFDAAGDLYATVLAPDGEGSSSVTLATFTLVSDVSA